MIQLWMQYALQDTDPNPDKHILSIKASCQALQMQVQESEDSILYSPKGGI